MNYDEPLAVRVWGDFACFTRPEAKVERMTYPVMTPSAARGVLESIFWKPEFWWRVDEIWVLEPVKYFSIMRNEVKSRAVEQSARRGVTLIAPEDRTQRHTIALRDVSYIIRGQAVPFDTGSDPAKYRDQFRRRVRSGQCFSRPYLGCREFSADFSEPSNDEKPQDISHDLGRMLLDLQFVSDRSGEARPFFFDARLERGILRVPSRADLVIGTPASAPGSGRAKLGATPC